MKYCVEKGTTRVIDGSENSEEIMLKNAESSGFTNEQVEILIEEEYKTRVDSIPSPAVPKTDLEILQEKVNSNQTALDFILMNF